MAINKETRIRVYNKFNAHCAYCGEVIKYEDMQVDHIIPKRQFESYHKAQIEFFHPKFLHHLTKDDQDHFDNLNPACRVCNQWKSSLNLALFRTELSLQLNRLRGRSSNYRIALKYGLISENPKEIIFYFETLK